MGRRNNLFKPCQLLALTDSGIMASFSHENTKISAILSLSQNCYGQMMIMMMNMVPVPVPFPFPVPGVPVPVPVPVVPVPVPVLILILLMIH
jgi:hypothetical protein